MKVNKLQVLKRDCRNQFNKYYRTMSYKIFYTEIEALYNLLVLKVRSTDQLTREWEAQAIDILNLTDFK